MIKRLYVHNFRCLENFELTFSGSSVLLIGPNGSGKSTVREVLRLLQRIARGTDRVGDLVTERDFAFERSQVPMRFELEVDLAGSRYFYSLALELPPGFSQLRVLEEKLLVEKLAIFTRETAEVEFFRSGLTGGSRFRLDWHLAALPIIQAREEEPIHVFRQWLAGMVLLNPVPSRIDGFSSRRTVHPAPDMSDFSSWLSGLAHESMSIWGTIKEYLEDLMPDLTDIKNTPTGGDSTSLEIQFARDKKKLLIPFGSLSDGEKCFMISALVIAANDVKGPLLCYWDEPDSHLALSEVGHFVMGLRRTFENSGGQLILSSHNAEAIRKFSDENTRVLWRRGHLEPTQVRGLGECDVTGDLVSALTRGDVGNW